MPAFAPATNDEHTLLLAYLELQRQGLRNAAFGLTDDQARLTASVSALSVGGAIKHVAGVEEYWIGLVLQKPWSGNADDKQSDYESSFRLLPNETLAGTLEHYASVAKATEETIRAIPDLSQPVPVPQDMPWFPKDVEAWSVRWVLLHIIEETARHAGHADIIRESIDGATMYPLMAAAEGWPATEWLKPWSADAEA